MLAAVALHGCALEYASEELQKDREVVLTAVTQDGKAMQFASRDFWRDREFVLAVAAVQSFVTEKRKHRSNKVLFMKYVSVELRADRELVMAAVAQDGLALEYASEKLRADREVVWAAVMRDGHALEYASEKLRADRLLRWISVDQIDGSGPKTLV